ncbi:MAG: hypothetical protein QOG75_5962 [Mycobacterium sp.]|jgi:hypothetical protein|nr:hypothetical protein [Mycobacterium sp.]
MTNPFFPGDGGDWYGSEVHNICYLTTLGTALTSARDGSLAHDWRDHIQAPRQNPDTAAALAIEEVRQMPTAAWEPGHAPDWRRAIDAWYTTSRLVLARQFSQKARATLTSIDQNVCNLAQIARIHPRPLNEYLEAHTDRHDERIDSNLHNQHHGYIRDRDILRADYLAGLCAGGEDHDWIGWLRARVDTWPEKQLADAYRVRMSTSAFRTVKERLPDYWTNP